MTLAIGALPFAPNILIDPLISSLFYLSFYSMPKPQQFKTITSPINSVSTKTNTINFTTT
jgi:hypothetical protein